MPLISPLYNVLKNLLKKNFVIQNFKIKDMQQEIRNYFLIEVDVPSSELIIQDYNLIDVHFSVDELYDPGVNSGYGYTPMHYTEVYFSVEENKHIVVHGYINMKGEYQYSQVKELNTSKEFTGTFITLSDAQEKILEKKIKEFKPFTDAIFDEHLKLEQYTKQKADNLEKDLTLLSRDLNQLSVRTKYLEMANLFSQAVKEFNQYSFVKDVRDKVVLRMFNNMEIIRRCIESSKQEPILLAVPDPEEKEASEISSYLPQDASLSDLYKITMKNIKNTMQSVKKTKFYTVENLILINQCAEQMHMQTLVFYSFPIEIVKKEDSLYVYEYNSKLNKYYDPYLELFKNSALAGDLNTVKQLFPFLKSQITDDFYSNLLDQLMNNPWNELMVNVLKVCDYLNEEDANYRNFVLKASQENYYPVPKKIAKLNSLEQHKVSLLFHLYLENKLPVFEVLLAHGACPNTWGIAFNKFSPSNLFTCINYFPQVEKDYLKYLEILLFYKVDPNKITTKAMSATFMKYKLELSKEKLKSKKKEKFLKSSFCEQSIEKFINIKKLIANRGFEGFNLILDIASPISLAYCLIFLSESELLQKAVLHARFSYGIYCDDTFYAAIEKVPDLAKKGSDLSSFPSYICFPFSENSLDDNVIARELLEKIYLLEKKITAKVLTFGTVEFEKQYEKLFNQGQEDLVQKKCNNAYYSFVGCEFLLMKRAFGVYVSQKDIKSFVKSYSRSLYDNIIQIIPRIVSSKVQVETMVASYKATQTYFLEFLPDKSLEIRDERQKIIKNYFPVNSVQPEILPFCEAARDGNLEALQQLLSSAKSISLDTTAKGWTPLHFPCAKGKLECAKALILSGARIDIDNDKGKKALSLVKDKTQAEVLKQTYARVHSS